jgi:hypothetical protein
MPTEFKKDAIPKPVGLGLRVALSSRYQVAIKLRSSHRQVFVKVMSGSVL